VLAIDRARAALDWTPATPFTEGLRKMLAWMQSHAKHEIGDR